MKGFANLEQPIANIRSHGVPVVVAVNAFKNDSPDELNWVCEQAEAAAVSTHWTDGGEGWKGLQGRRQSRCVRGAIQISL